MNEIRGFERATMVVEPEAIYLLFRYKRNANEMLYIIKNIASSRGFITILDIFVLVGIHNSTWLRMNFDSLENSCVTNDKISSLAVKFSNEYPDKSIIKISKDMLSETPSFLI